VYSDNLGNIFMKLCELCGRSHASSYSTHHWVNMPVDVLLSYVNLAAYSLLPDPCNVHWNVLNLTGIVSQQRMTNTTALMTLLYYWGTCSDWSIWKLHVLDMRHLTDVYSCLWVTCPEYRWQSFYDVVSHEPWWICQLHLYPHHVNVESHVHLYTHCHDPGTDEYQSCMHIEQTRHALIPNAQIIIIR